MTVSLLNIKPYSWVCLVKLYGEQSGHLGSRLMLPWNIGVKSQNCQNGTTENVSVSSVNEMLHQSASVELNRFICLCGQIVARGMKARRSGGSIVNVSSQASRCALRDHAIYCEYQCCLTRMYKTDFFFHVQQAVFSFGPLFGSSSSISHCWNIFPHYSFLLIFSKGFSAALIKSSLYGPKSPNSAAA